MGNMGHPPKVLGTFEGPTPWWGGEVWGPLLGGCVPFPAVLVLAQAIVLMSARLEGILLGEH